MRRPRPLWRTLTGLGAGLAALAATATLALTRNGGARPGLPLAPLTTLGHLRPAPAAGLQGPENVPIPDALGLAPPRLLRPGEQVDGIGASPGCTRTRPTASSTSSRLCSAPTRSGSSSTSGAIELEAGRRLVAPDKITFPPGL
jgi:hypothetical protein